MSTWDKFTNFISSHRAAVLIGSAAVITSTAGVYYYYSTVDSSAKPVKKSKKKTEKKKSTKKATTDSTSKPSTSVSEKKELGGFPLVKEPITGVEYPEIPQDASLKNLSTEDKEAIANQFKLVGNSFFGVKKYEEALDYYQRAINVSNDPIYYSNRAACYSALEQYDKVISETTAALKMKPDYMKCILRRSVAYEKLGQLDDAILDTTCALILKNFSEPSLNATVDRLIQERSKEMLVEVEKNRKPKFPSASFCSAFLSSICDVTVLPEFVENAEAGTADGEIKLALEALKIESVESYETALEHFNRAIELDGEHTYYALGFRAALKFLCSDIEAARDDARTSISLKGTVIPYLINASIELEQSNLSGATVEMAQAEVVDPTSSFVAFHRGQLLFLLGQLKEGLELFEKAAKLNPYLIMAHIQAAVSLYRLGDGEGAHKRFDTLAADFPKNPMVRLYEGEIFMDEKDFDKAESCFDKASELSNEKAGDVNVQPLVNKALVYVQKGQTNEAIELIRKATTLDPRSDLAWSTLYQFYMQLQDPENTTKALNKAIEVSRSPAEIAQHISLLVATKTQERLKSERPFFHKKMSDLQQATRASAYAQEIAGRA